MARPSRAEPGVSAYVVLILLTVANHFKLHTLADFVQGSLMLRYNKRNVG